MTDAAWMEEALRLATQAEAAGEVPVGAIVVCDEKIVGRGFNRNRADNDPSAHAEMIALRQAGRAIGNHRLEGCTLFATIEPCAMCAGALVHARVRRLVYGASDPKAGAVHSVMQVVNHPKLNHRMEVAGGVMADTCGALLQNGPNRGVAARVALNGASIPVEFRVSANGANEPAKMSRDHESRRGEVRERLKRSASKADIPGRVSRVRISPSPPELP